MIRNTWVVLVIYFLLFLPLLLVLFDSIYRLLFLIVAHLPNRKKEHSSHPNSVIRLLILIVARDELCRRFMRIPGVGPVTALAFKTGMDDPTRFKRSRDIPAQLGLVPRKYASGETDYNGGITKAGDVMLRHHLYRAAATLTQNSARPCNLKEWGRNLRKRSSYKSSTVAVARKLSIILHRMWMDGTEFDWGDRQRKGAAEKRSETDFLNAA